MLAVIDANNFYATAEVVMRPALRGHPVIVLSNNDGCAISRSEEAKALGVKMGQPLFQLRDLVQHKGLIALSANFEYYGDMSDRLMSLAAGLGPTQEIYSIDECWIGDLQGVRNLTQRAWAIRSRILQWVGLPTGIGLAPSKTLAKLCNHAAKSADRKPGSYPAALAKVCNWQDLDAGGQRALLQATGIADIWGIGRKLAPQLAEQGYLTALDVANMPASHARNQWGVTMERTVHELNGISCIPLELNPPAKQQIAVTRSFGHPIMSLPPLLEAVSTFASAAAEKLRKAGLRASAVMVFIRTSPFRDGERFYRTTVLQLNPPSSDTKQIVNTAVHGLKSIYEPGHDLAKAGVILLDLASAGHQQLDMLATPSKRDQSALMEVVDQVNGRFGRGAIHLASTGQALHHQAGLAGMEEGGWRSKQSLRTPRYTTRLEEIPTVRA